MMLKSKLIIVILINLVLANAFFYSNSKLSVNNLSSDLANIIPICKKIDNPNLYQKDLYLHDIKNVEYYTPFFVETLRFIAKFTDSDYMLATNVLAFITHFFYGLLWFFFFYSLKKDFWLALLFSFFIRGLIWAPGMEILGISGLWTIMPRTVYTALLPLPFLLYYYCGTAKTAIAAFVLGLIFNFHPISGIGGVVIYFSALITSSVLNKQYKHLSFYKTLFIAFVFCFIGMIPFLLTYFLNVNNDAIVNQVDFENAFLKRIPFYFLDPIDFVKTWSRPVTYAFGLCFIIYYFFDKSIKKRNFKIVLVSVFLVFLTANASFYVESFLNTYFDKHIRMSFQLMRFQKFAIVLFQIAMFLLSVEIVKKLKLNERWKQFVFLFFISILFLCRLPSFDNTPLLGDDLLRGILPENIGVFGKEMQKSDYAKMLDYIELNTEPDAVFYGKASFFIRAGANRSVVLDGKGAGMLIEGNQKEFVQWYKDISYLNDLNEFEKIDFLKKKKVNYMISIVENENLNLKTKRGKYYLYKLQ